MSEIKYGLISQTDARTLEKTIDLICEQSTDGVINICEVGLYSGATSNALYDYVTGKVYGSSKSGGYAEYVFKCNLTGVDNLKDDEKIIDFPKEGELIIGNSNEVYSQIEDDSQHLIFVDGCHCFSHVISDFFCYAPKVKVGGYLAFHDTGKHIKPFKDFQHGDETNPRAYISVREALKAVGLFNRPSGYAINVEALKDMDIANKDELIAKFNKMGAEMGITQLLSPRFPNWELIFDEADETNEAGGICVFKKL